MPPAQVELIISSATLTGGRFTATILFYTLIMKNVTFSYDFNVHGGAIGTIISPIWIPLGASITSLMVRPANPILTSSGLTEIDINLGNTSIIDNSQIGTSGTYTDYNAGTYGFLQDGVKTNLIRSNFIGLTTTAGRSNINMIISVSPLTGGSFSIIIFYSIVAYS